METNIQSEVKVKKRRAPSAKRAATKAQKESNRGFPLPLELKCPVTGKINKYTSIPYIRKLIAKYGTIEEIKSKYVSGEGKKLQKNNNIAQ